jgi:hypothetical protein
MATLQDAIDEIQARIALLDGIRIAPSFAPDQIGAFPAAIAFPRRGTWTLNDATWKTGLHTIVLEVHIARHDMARDIQAAMAYSDTVPNAIMQGLIGNIYTAITAFGPISYEFGPMAWGMGNDILNTIGWRFFIENIKLQSAVT